MPFVSERQRRWMWLHYPEIAKRWTEKYGPKPRPKRKRAKKKRR